MQHDRLLLTGIDHLEDDATDRRPHGVDQVRLQAVVVTIAVALAKQHEIGGVERREQGGLVDDRLTVDGNDPSGQWMIAAVHMLPTMDLAGAREKCDERQREEWSSGQRRSPKARQLHGWRCRTGAARPPAMAGRVWRIHMVHAISSHVNRPGKLWPAQCRAVDPIAIR